MLNISGPALLFRSSNAVVARAYSGTPYPRVTQLGNDFFKSGLIRSETDYIIYEEMNDRFIPGLDFAFYRPRALYHTGLDDIRHTSRGSLQHILLAGLTSTRNLANDVSTESFAYGGLPVYFDFLGGRFTEIGMGAFWIWNLLFLLLCPWILGYAFYYRVKNYGKIRLQGFGVTVGSVFSALLIVLLSMFAMSKTSPAVWPFMILLRVVGICTSYSCVVVRPCSHVYDILSGHKTKLFPSSVNSRESR